MIQLVCAHAVVAVLAPLLFKYFGRKAFWMLALAPASAAVWAITQYRAVFSGNHPVQRYEWVSDLSLNVVFRLDVLGWVMTLIVGGIGALILIYCWGYFGRKASNLGRFGGVFVAFAGAMFGLVTADNTVLVYLFWELTTIFSFLLIGHYHERQPSRMAAMQAIIVTTLGGLAMLAGIVILGVAPGGSFVLSDLIASAANGTLGVGTHPAMIPTAVGLVVLGAITKSAQVPFHFWLPAAMAAPTPVSGYLHAAAMVKAGVYLIARLAPGFAATPGWQPVIVIVGLATMILGGYRSLRQWDLKLLLAFGTVSQLGFIMVLVGYGDRGVALAGLAMLCAHALFKAALFLVVGAIDHEMGTRDLRELSGLGRAMPGLAVAATLAAASMAGLPPLLGYVAKEGALHAFVVATDWPVFVGVVLGSILTMGYTLRFLWGAFASKRGVDEAGEHRLDIRMLGPIMVLALTGLVAGMVPGTVERLLSPHADTYPGEPGHLALWGGFGLPVLATGLIITAGALLFWRRDQVGRAQARYSVVSADSIYRRSIRRLNSVAADVTAMVQTGSQPTFLTVMLLTMVGAIGLVVLVGQVPQLGPMRLWDTPLQGAVALVACVAAVLVVRSRRRMKAVLLMAFIGFATALLFALQGAPDLALTQALVETVTLVVFVLVLRRLPPFFSNRPYMSSRVYRVLVGVVVGVAVAMLGWAAASARVHAPVTIDYPDEVLLFGYGRNIVNVTLVDTRAWDTLGEISVVLSAATGVASLIFIRDRFQRGDMQRAFQSAIASKGVWAARQRDKRAEAEQLLARSRPAERAQPLSSQGRGRVWLPGVATLSPIRRSLIFEIGARMVFHPLVLFSLFLLFSGHNNPGGGFAGGMLAGIALVIRYLAGGRYELVLATRIRPGTLLGIGMILATTAALVPVAFGGTILQTTVFDLVLPIFNEVHVATALFFDTGVYLIVIGLVLDILTSLGAEVDRQAEAEGLAAPEVAPDDDSPDVVEEVHVGEDIRAEIEPAGAGRGLQ